MKIECIVIISLAFIVSSCEKNGKDNSPTVGMIDYVDEFGINQGKGVQLGENVWAPVNCGYHVLDFPYGKLYQWGRKFGQGFGERWDGFELDFQQRQATLQEGQSLEAAGQFFGMNWDWLIIPNDELWNKGSELNPVKSQYDPCPSGWRVPTSTELEKLIKRSLGYTIDEKAFHYRWRGEDLFLPAYGHRYHTYDVVEIFGYTGTYWSSTASNSKGAICLRFDGWDNYQECNLCMRATGCSIRCVQE